LILINRGSLIEKIDNSLDLQLPLSHFKRFELKDNPISFRTPIGTKNGIFWNTGDEHNEKGHITEDPDMRIKMMNKRMSKLELVLDEITDDEKIRTYYESSEIIIDLLKIDGINIQFIQIKLLNPFPKVLLENLLSNAKIIINVEMNYSSQLARLIKQNTNKEVDYEIVKYNGRPIASDELYYAIKNILNKNINERRVVLDHGT
jgi:2-oxoglutarate ferredoxin oxidoreductase subunit alpha